MKKKRRRNEIEIEFDRSKAIENGGERKLTMMMREKGGKRGQDLRKLKRPRSRGREERERERRRNGGRESVYKCYGRFFVKDGRLIELSCRAIPFRRNV